MLLDDGSWDDADIKFFSQSLVGGEIGFILGAERDEVGIVGKPVR